jgi:hypothetical protein
MLMLLLQGVPKRGMVDAEGLCLLLSVMTEVQERRLDVEWLDVASYFDLVGAQSRFCRLPGAGDFMLELFSPMTTTVIDNLPFLKSCIII